MFFTTVFASDSHITRKATLPEKFHDMNATGYFTHKDCWKHEMGTGHPECPERLDAIEDWLLATGVKDALDVREARKLQSVILNWRMTA